jgi:ligand-binding sensor domain-containing protein
MKIKLRFIFLLFQIISHICLAQQWKNITNCSAILDLKVYDNNLWVGSQAGVLKIDLFNGTQTKYTCAEGLIQNWITSISKNPIDGSIWFGGMWGYGLSSFNGTNWNKIPISQNIILFGDHDKYNVTELKFDQLGKLWIATEDAFVKYENNSWQQLIENIYATCINIDNNIVWIGTMSNGLIKYDGTATYYDTNNSGILSDNVTDLAVDDQNNLWISTTGGINVFDGTNWGYYNSSNSGLPNGTPKEILFDNSNNLWVLFSYQLAKYDGNTWQIFDSTNVNLFNSDYFSSIAVDDQNNIYVGTTAYYNRSDVLYYTGGGRILKFDDQQWTEIVIQENQLTFSAISVLSVDNYNNIYIGSLFDGYVKYDASGFTYVSAKNSPFYPSNYVTTIAAMGENIYIKGDAWDVSPGGHYSGGLIKYDASSLEILDEEDFFYSDIKVKEILYLLYDSNENLWVGLNGKGSLKFDGVSWFEFNLNNSPLTQVKKIKEDKQGNIWFMQESSIIRYEQDTFTVFNTSNSPFTLIQDFDFDQDNILYVLERFYINKIYKYDGFSWETINRPVNSYTANSRCLAVDKNNKVWIGTYGDGVYSFDGNNWENYTGKNSGTGYEFISTILVDNNNNKYFGSSDFGSILTLFNENGILNIGDGVSDNKIGYYLSNNYPNPFNPTTKIEIKILMSGYTQVIVYDILGKEIITLLNSFKQAGNYEVEFNGNNLPSGVYFYRIISGNYSETKKMVLLK